VSRNETTQLVSRNENNAQLCTAVNRLAQPPATAYNRLQPPTTAYDRLRPPTTACNRLQPPATACTACTAFLQQNRLFLPTPLKTLQDALFICYKQSTNNASIQVASLNDPAARA
ncbi:hypothetical protein TNCV_4390011, partial [Trichonephila clavipes]